MADDNRPVTIADFFAYLVADDSAASAREQFCDVVAAQIENVASWLTVDAWLGAGDVVDTTEQKPALNPERQRSFAAVALVAEISANLVSGALALLRGGNEYSAFALIRQLIECEYLLRAFRLKFTDAAKWYDANHKQRWDFTPSKLRRIGGFDAEEYGNHCEAGGHPHPAGRPLLTLSRAMHDADPRLSGDSAPVDARRAYWLDFALHCDRTWRALSDVLLAEHARFGVVRSNAIAAVDTSRSTWHGADLLGRDVKMVLGALNANPNTPLDDLLEPS